MTTTLEDLWRTNDQAGYYASPRTFFEEARRLIPNLTYKQVVEFLKQQPAYYLYKESKSIARGISQRQTHVSGPGTVYFDSMHLRSFPGGLKGNFKYVTFFIDIFTGYAFARPLRTLSGQGVKRIFLAFVNELDKLGIEITHLVSDRGRENIEVKKYAESNMPNVDFYYPPKTSPSKANYAERIIRTCRQHAARIMHDNKKRMLAITAIQRAVEVHNNTKNSRTKLTPLEAIKNPAEALRRKLDVRFEEASKIADHIKNPKYNINDVVLVRNTDRDAFSKSSDRQWLDEKFVITDIVPTFPIFSYKIRRETSDRSLQDSYPETLLTLA